MPNIPPPPCQDGSAPTDADLAALLAGKRDAAPRLQPVADVLAALTAEPSPAELAGEAGALAEFRHRIAVPERRRALLGATELTSRLSAKVAAAATAIVVVLGGAATAAFANMLPAPIQRLAHDAIGAPYTPPSPQHGPARREPAAPGQFASHGKLTAPARPGSKEQHGELRPAVTPADEGNPHGQGQPGSGQGQPGSGQGQPGSGQGQPGSGQGQPGSGQGNPHGQGQGRGNPHHSGQHGNPHVNLRLAAHHARPARHRPAIDP